MKPIQRDKKTNDAEDLEPTNVFYILFLLTLLISVSAKVTTADEASLCQKRCNIALDKTLQKIGCQGRNCCTMDKLVLGFYAPSMAWGQSGTKWT